jgi:hypothetical protein
LYFCWTVVCLKSSVVVMLYFSAWLMVISS